LVLGRLGFSAAEPFLLGMDRWLLTRYSGLGAVCQMAVLQAGYVD